MIRRWAEALFGTPRRVAVTLVYLVGASAFMMVVGEVLGQNGFTAAEFVKGLFWALLMSPILHPALGRGPDGGSGGPVT